MTQPWDDGWRLNAPRVRRLRAGEEERTVALSVPAADEAAGPGPLAIQGRSAIHVEVDGQSIEFTPAPPPTIEEAVRHAIDRLGRPRRHADGADARARHRHPRVARLGSAGPAGHRGDRGDEDGARRGRAGRDGVLSRIEVTDGQQVQRGDLLGEVTPASEA